MKYLAWVWSGSSRDRFSKLIGIYLPLSVPGRSFFARAPLYRGCCTLILPEYARIALAATAPSILHPLFHCMSCPLLATMVSYYSTLLLPMSLLGSPNRAFIFFTRLTDCTIAHEGNHAMKKSGAGRQRVRGTAVVTLDVESLDR